VEENELRHFGTILKRVRKTAGFSQAQLAKTARVPRLRIVRAESGVAPLKLNEAVQVAAALKIPLERLVSGRWKPHTDLRGIAAELFQLGIRDLEIASPRVPGAFRCNEETLVLALKGDRPEPRVIEAIPFILCLNRFNVPLTIAFARFHDIRVRTRLAWLSEIALTISRSSSFPMEIASETQLDAFVERGKKAKEPDSLGHPREGKLPPQWARWNVTYAGTLTDFIQRTTEVNLAFRRSTSTSGE
jgi:transcriptional regulator with XRE-family HTH domain